MRRLVVRLSLRRGGRAQKAAPAAPRQRLLLAAVLVTSLPWMGALLAYAVQAAWPLSAAQVHWLHMVRYGCAAVLLAEWVLALVAASVWAVVMLVRRARRVGTGPGSS